MESEGSSCLCAFACRHKEFLLACTANPLSLRISVPKPSEVSRPKHMSVERPVTCKGRPLRPVRQLRDSRVSSRRAPTWMELTESDRRQPAKGDKGRVCKEEPGRLNEKGGSPAQRGRCGTFPQVPRTGHQLKKAASPLGSGDACAGSPGGPCVDRACERGPRRPRRAHSPTNERSAICPRCRPPHK